MNSQEKIDLQNGIITYNTMSVKYVETLKGEYKEIELDGLIEDIKSEYDDETCDGKNYYEMFDMVNEEWKVHFDFDKKMTITKGKTFDKEKYYKKILVKLNYIFDVKDEDWAISEDSRTTKDSKGSKFYKISYHFILVNRKTTYNYLYPKIKYIYKIFKEEGIEFDTSIYRKGMTKFRIVCCKKDNETKSLLKPITYTDDIKKHIIQNTYGCEELFIKEDKMTQIKNSISSASSIEDKLNQYEIIGTTNKNGIKFHNCKGECPFVKREHTHNHFYIVEKEDSLELKCHSNSCKGKLMVLYRKNSDYSLFNLDVFNNIGKGRENYIERRKYFEKHYIFIRNTDTTYNIIYRKNSIGCYERELVEVKDRGLNNLVYHKMEKNKDGEDELKTKKFFKFYHDDDQTRRNYQTIDFDPRTENVLDVYNLFNGFNYENILEEEDEITDKQDLDFLLNFLKENVCENNDKIFHYFISNLAIIIQKPEFLTHIITLFYSAEEGTGKSSFLKFFSKVLGEIYTFFGSITDIIEKHSTSAVGTLINVIEELKSNKEATELLKNYSQREKAPINQKNKAINNVSTYVHYFIASNLRKCISLKRGERRYFIVKFNKVKDKNVINKMDKIYKDKKVIYLFGDYLKNYPLTEEQKINRKWWEDNKPNTKTYRLFINNDNISVFLRELYTRTGYFNRDHIKEEMGENLKGDVIILQKEEFYSYYVDYMSFIESSKYKYKKAEFQIKLIEEHSLYITMKNPKNVKKYYINLEKLFKNMDFEETEFVNKYSPDYIEPEEDEEDDEDEKKIDDVI